MCQKIFTQAVILSSLLFLAGCVEQPKELTKEQLNAAKPFILKTKPAISHPLTVNFENYVEFLGYDVSPEGVIRPGQVVTVTWYWRSLRKLDDGWLLFTHLVDAKNVTCDNFDNEGVIRRNYPPGKWKPGEYIKDVQRIIPISPTKCNSPKVAFHVGVWFGPHRLKIETGPKDRENRARVLVLQTTVKAEEETPVSLAAYKAEDNIVVDGKLDEKTWKSARNVTLGDPVTGGKMFPPTNLKVAWDEKNLYVAFDSEDDNLLSTFKNRDDPIYNQDAVEVFLDPDGDGKNYYEFQVAPSGVIFDSFLPEYRRNRNEWNSGIQAAVSLDGTLNKEEDLDRKWVVEMAIPLKDAGVEKVAAGDKWKANFFRMDSAKAGRKAFAWSAPLNNDFHNLERFGQIVFEEKPPAALPTAGTATPAPPGETTKPTAGELAIRAKPLIEKLAIPSKIAVPTKTKK